MSVRWRKQFALLARMDWAMVGAMVVLAAISVLFIYSASYRGPGQPMPDFYRQQMMWFALGAAAFVIAAWVDYRWLCQWATVGMVLAVGLLVLVLAVGKTVNGAKSWLGWGGYGIQPAEFAKLSVIVALAYYLFDRPPEARRLWKTVAVAFAVVALPMGLILAQPDLGSAMVLIPVAYAMLFVGGARIKQLVLVTAVALAMSPVAWWQLKDYQKARLTVFLHPEKDPLGSAWNLNQSLIAVGSGGLTGKGYLQGTQNLLGYLPRTVAPNDFLFSVIAEEKGFLGAMAVIGCYVVILFSGLRIAAYARDRLGTLLATGVVAMLFFHVFINIGMTIGLMPITGLPLPLLSYGGSFVIASMTALGLLQSVWVRRRI